MWNVTLAERAKQLAAMEPQVRNILRNAARNATIRAVEKATEMTPPTGGDLKGTNTRAGEMKQHWATDSRTEPRQRGDRLETVLANDRQYASYVNDGHRMDRHFVPGLVINEESGLLEMNPDGKGGIVVGTKTKYVPGLHMVDAAQEVYRETVRRELKPLEELLK